MPSTLYLGTDQNGYTLEGFMAELVNQNDPDDPRPTGQQSCNGLQCEVRVSDDPAISNWASDASKANRRDGRVEFERNGIVFKKLYFFDAYAEGYSVAAAAGLTPRHVFTIMPRQLSQDSEQPQITFPWDSTQ